MPRRFLRNWALWLLPVLVARAFLPIGFMLSFQDGGLDVAFCPSQSPALVAMLEGQAPAAQSHTHHTGHAEHQSADGASVELPPCPYGTAALAISVDVPHAASAAPHVDDYSASFDTPFLAGIGPLRAERIRGPPFVS